MLSIRSSPTKERNPSFKQERRKKGEDNARWVARNRPTEDAPCLVLLGGTDTLDFRLRAAQSHARHDLTPSHWSHVVLLDAPAKTKSAVATLTEISLNPPQGFGFPPVKNGVQSSDFARYADAAIWPNVAIIYLPVEAKKLHETVDRFTRQRSALDATELIVDWLAFGWGVGRVGNPLLDGKGIPAAVLIEYVLGGLQFELTPGLDSRSSCPEAIWQAAMWWHEYYKESGGRALNGRWVVDHGLVEKREYRKPK
jgi:hypothetical protein